MAEVSWYVVDNIVDGKHGKYAVVRDPKLGSVTFSLDLDHKVWKENRLPETGSEVVLRDIEKKRGGWRAMFARFLRPEDVASNNNSNQHAPQKKAWSKEQ